MIRYKLIRLPARKILIKRGQKADNYWDYSQEVGCDIWDDLKAMAFRIGEPLALWLPERLIINATSKYVQGIQVDEQIQDRIPNGFDIIELDAADYLQFQSEPFEEEDYQETKKGLQDTISQFDYKELGYRYDHNQARIQLEPIGERGYIELVPVKLL